MQCQHIKDDQIQCKAQALTGKNLCFTHDPEMASQRLLANRNGGLARRQFEVYADAVTLNKPQDIQKLMETTINGVLTGTIPASQPANTIGFLSHCWLDAYEKGEVYNRLNAVEKQLEKYHANQNRK